MQAPQTPRSTHPFQSRAKAVNAAAFVGLLALAACSRGGDAIGQGGGGDSSGAATVEEGRALFREGTFELDRFWSDGVGLDSGLAASGFTTRNALEVGLQIDATQISPLLLNSILAGLDSGGTGDGLVGDGSDAIDDPAVFTTLLRRGAVVGLIGVEVDGLQGLDLLGTDRLGLSCALCHSMVDGSTYDGTADDAPLPGSIGLRMDGTAPANLRPGALFAYAERSRLLYPYLPQSHATIGGFPIARTDAFVSDSPTEAEVDALLADDGAFPAGLWDVTPDGIGNPTVMPPVYDIRPAAPYGIAGEFPELVDAINAHMTLGLDPTFLLAPEGTVFMNAIGNGIGTEIANEFEDLALDAGLETPAGGYPFVEAERTGAPGTLTSPVGLRIERDDLRALAVFLQDLREPDKAAGNPSARQRGEIAYEALCTDCHGDMGELSPHQVISLLNLVVPYAPTTLLARGFPYSDVLDDRLKTYDDRLVVFDRLYSSVQVPAQAREISAPHLTGLHLRTMFLHDGSVETLDELLDPARGAGAPHPFYVDPLTRADLIEFLVTE